MKPRSASLSTTPKAVFPAGPADWTQTEFVVEMVREISLQTDPQAMIKVFRKRAHALYGASGSISLSRRALQWPEFRITRSTTWTEDVNPWKEPQRLPLLSGGLLAELLYDNQARVLTELSVPRSDPAHEYLKEARSLVALPLYEDGAALNMVVRISGDPWEWDDAQLAHAVLEANLFGRATSHLLTAQRLREAYAQLDHELKRVADIQRSLLPERIPDIPTLDIAASYRTAARAGGDYYDIFDLGKGRWGFLIADVSGHGAPAAVVMAILRTILHGECHSCFTAGGLLERVNAQLCHRLVRRDGTFVTAFYGIYDCTNRSLQYSCAGHNPPMMVDGHARVRELDDAHDLPLAVERDLCPPQRRIDLVSGDALLLYTDGITEATNPEGEMYGRQRLLSCLRGNASSAGQIIDCVEKRLSAFAGPGPANDDQTLVAVRVR